MKRNFTVNTPIGKLQVCSKYESDSFADYPGVYISLDAPAICDGDGLLCCVEYDSVAGKLQTVVYQPEQDEPVEIVQHKIPDDTGFRRYVLEYAEDMRAYFERGADCEGKRIRLDRLNKTTRAFEKGQITSFEAVKLIANITEEV